MPSDAVLDSMRLVLSERFGEEFSIDPELSSLHELARIARHRLASRLLRASTACFSKGRASRWVRVCA